MMFRDKSISKFYAFALAAVFALTLAGCGGSGGGSADMAPPVVESPTPEEIEAAALKDAQDGAMAAYMAAAAAVGGAVDPVAAGNAYKYAAAAKEASDAAAAAATSAMAVEYQTAAETAQASAEMAAGMRGLGITGLANKITNQSDIDNAELEGKTGDDVPKPVSNSKRVGAAFDLTAMAPNQKSETPLDGTLAAVPNGSSHQGAQASVQASVRATYNAAGPRFTVTLPTGAILRGEKPTPLMTAGEKPTGGWPGAELVRTDTTPGKTYVNVFTDINAPTQEYTDPTPGVATELTLPAAPAVSILTGDVTEDGSSFTGTLNANSTDNNPPVAGKFVCPSGEDCSISVDADGTIVAIQGYEFHAAAGVTKADTDYMAWGVWLTVPDGTTPADLATAGAFASGNQVFNVKAVLKGTATYNGDASGLYAAGGMVEYFDADVTLEANFGGNVGADSGDANADPEGDDLLGAVTGSVFNIRAAGMDVEGSLTLKKATILDTGDAGSFNGGFSADVSGTLAGRAMDGNWGGQFYGPSNATGKAAETQYPTTAAGTFGAYAPGHANDPIRILGAFGAWKAE